MVYSNNFVLCVLLNGKPQKELANGQVKLPFDTEYALRLRNRNNRRAVVMIYIDGENVSGGGYVVNANDYVDIKRHENVDRAFKFVSLDSEDAIDYGKNGPNDDKVKGTIEARFYLEKEKREPQIIHYNRDNPHPMLFGTPRGAYCQDSQTKTISVQSFNSAQSGELEDGCTVEGHVTGQNFRSTHVELEDSFTSVKIFLQGTHEEKSVQSYKKTNKDQQIEDLENEISNLRLKLAEIEKKKLEEELEKISE